MKLNYPEDRLRTNLMVIFISSLFCLAALQAGSYTSFIYAPYPGDNQDEAPAAAHSAANQVFSQNCDTECPFRNDGSHYSPIQVIHVIATDRTGEYAVILISGTPGRPESFFVMQMLVRSGKEEAEQKAREVAERMLI